MKILFIDSIHPLLKSLLKKNGFICDEEYSLSKKQIEMKRMSKTFEPKEHALNNKRKITGRTESIGNEQMVKITHKHKDTKIHHLSQSLINMHLESTNNLQENVQT